MPADAVELAVVQAGQEQGLLGVAGAGGEQALQAAVLLEVVESAEGGDDPLAGAAVGPVILDDLQVAAWAGGFDAEEHRKPPCATPDMVTDGMASASEKWGKAVVWQGIRGTRIDVPENRDTQIPREKRGLGVRNRVSLSNLSLTQSLVQRPANFAGLEKKAAALG